MIGAEEEQPSHMQMRRPPNIHYNVKKAELKGFMEFRPFETGCYLVMLIGLKVALNMLSMV